MAEQNFDIIMRVVGGKVAEAQLAGVAGATEDVGAAQIVASKKARTASSGFAKQAVAIGALWGGYKLLKGSVQTTMDLAKSSAAFQRATGLDYRTSQAWVVVARERGIQTKQLQISMATLGRQLGGLTPASKSSVQALKTLGLEQSQLAKMPMRQRLDEIANAFQRLPDGPTKAAAAQRLFGRAGQALLPILNQGAKGMNEQLGAAERLVPANQRSAAAALRLAAQQRELNTAMTGVKLAIGTALIPILGALARVFTPIATQFAVLMQHSQAFRVGIYVLTAAIGGLLISTRLIIPALEALGAAELVASAPITIWIVALAALAAAFLYAYTHVKWFHNAVNAVVNFLKTNWKTAVTIAATVLLGPFAGALVLILTHLHTFENVASAVVGRVKAIFNGMVSFFGGLPGKIGHVFSGIFNGLYNAAWTVVHHILSMFANMASSIGSTIEHIASEAVNKIPGVSFVRKHLAAGGPVTQTGPYLVGERGPEVVTLTKGSTVIPNHQLGALAGGGAVTIHTHVIVDRKEIALAVGRYTSDQQKRR